MIRACTIERPFVFGRITSGTAKPCRAMRPLTHQLDSTERGLVVNASQGPKPRGITTTHGHQRNGKKSPTYLAWDGMIQRVRLPSYIEQGVTVADRWRKFEAFLADMGEKPDGLRLGRVGNTGNYEPGNVRWMTCSEILKMRVRSQASLDNLQPGLAGQLTHGYARRAVKSPTYAAWAAMIHRTTNPKARSYRHYGGRGITVCERWRESFMNFLEDMGERPEGLSLDRRDNDLGYWCGHCAECACRGRSANCRWATMAEQNRNKRGIRLLSFNGRTQCLTDWAAEIGLSPAGLSARLETGMSVEEALTRPRGRGAR